MGKAKGKGTASSMGASSTAVQMPMFSDTVHEDKGIGYANAMSHVQGQGEVVREYLDLKTCSGQTPDSGCDDEHCDAH